MDWKNLDAKKLDGACLDCKPINIDWREAYGEDGEGWIFMESAECPECGAENYAQQEADCQDCGEQFETYNEGPLMNYHYPIPAGEFSEENSARLSNLPLCLVEFEDGSCSLALTGGGMDLSWEIVEAFVQLGYLPPVHFCGDLPRMAGQVLDDKLKGLFAACEESLTISKGRATWALEKLRRQLADVACS